MLIVFNQTDSLESNLPLSDHAISEQLCDQVCLTRRRNLADAMDFDFDVLF